MKGFATAALTLSVLAVHAGAQTAPSPAQVVAFDRLPSMPGYPENGCPPSVLPYIHCAPGLVPVQDFKTCQVSCVEPGYRILPWPDQRRPRWTPGERTTREGLGERAAAVSEAAAGPDLGAAGDGLRGLFDDAAPRAAAAVAVSGGSGGGPRESELIGQAVTSYGARYAAVPLPLGSRGMDVHIAGQNGAVIGGLTGGTAGAEACGPHCGRLGAAAGAAAGSAIEDAGHRALDRLGDRLRDRNDDRLAEGTRRFEETQRDYRERLERQREKK